ncbi:hypothetical protein Pfo_007961 [Paulownia fortunei]|nr:hypothetical protein Pfo_007961 [Paulownia fortunei]
MALEWVVLGYAAAAEAIMLLLLTVPGLDPLRNGLISATSSLLKPLLSVVPFCLFLIMDIYWKYETRPSCDSELCSPSEYLRHQKSIMKSQRNALLIVSALIFYWLLYSVTGLVVKIDQLNKRIEKLKARIDFGFLYSSFWVSDKPILRNEFTHPFVVGTCSCDYSYKRFPDNELS